MAVFHQMGHDSVNLLGSEYLQKYAGALVSPVNYDPEKVKLQISEFQKNNFKFIFDPQLYAPQNAMSGLLKWAYFPNDSTTADLSNESWWFSINSLILKTILPIGLTSVCSPAPIPKLYSDEYFNHIVSIGNDLVLKATPDAIDVYQTVIINFHQMSEKHQSDRISSIVSKTKSDKIYLIINSDIEPRREFSDSNALSGCMKFISNLKSAGLKITVGFSSSDLLLWKLAGAENCATGKFFNLRRFTLSRFQENDSGGGGQLPYFFEENFFSFFREADLLRLEQKNLFNFNTSTNPLTPMIRDHIKANPPPPWVAHSWRHYLYWFADFESRITKDPLISSSTLTNAESSWLASEDQGILMDEMRNTGKWIRSWRQAINEYRSF